MTIFTGIILVGILFIAGFCAWVVFASKPEVEEEKQNNESGKKLSKKRFLIRIGGLFPEPGKAQIKLSSVLDDIYKSRLIPKWMHEFIEFASGSEENRLSNDLFQMDFIEPSLPVNTLKGIDVVINVTTKDVPAKGDKRGKRYLVFEYLNPTGERSTEQYCFEDGELAEPTEIELKVSRETALRIVSFEKDFQAGRFNVLAHLITGKRIKTDTLAKRR